MCYCITQEYEGQMADILRNVIFFQGTLHSNR